jgi:hypothetical protein
MVAARKGRRERRSPLRSLATFTDLVKFEEKLLPIMLWIILWLLIHHQISLAIG